MASKGQKEVKDSDTFELTLPALKAERMALAIGSARMGYKLDVSGTSPFDYARSMNVNKMMRAPNRKGSLRKKK